MPLACLIRWSRALARGLLLSLALSSAPLPAAPNTAALGWLLDLPPDKAAHLRQLIEAGARDPAAPGGGAPLAVTVSDAQHDAARTPLPAPAAPAAPEPSPAHAALLAAAQARVPALPPVLTPWLAWAAQAASAPLLCPWRADGSAPECAWPRHLTLDVGAAGADFSAEWEVFAASWLPLPGGADAWPQAVLLNGEPVGVVERDGVPMVQIPAAARPDLRLSGRLAWQTRPAALPLPTPAGPLRLTVDGQPASPAALDAAGRLWLEPPPAPPAAPLELTVTRLIEDGHPLRLTTELTLTSTGAPRDLALGAILPEGFMPLAVDSPLPAHLDAQGALTLRVAPGHWRLQVRARAVVDPAVITVPTLAPPWPATETWVWRADPDLRAVALSGLSPRAPAADLPADGPDGPAFIARGGEQLALTVTRRGPAAPPPVTLHLLRTAWLDFAAQGLTLQDTLTGVLPTPTRVTAGPPLQVTQVQLAGTAHTLVPGADAAAGPGLSLPGGPLTLAATHRLATPPAGAGGRWPLTLPAAGWQPAPVATTTQLHLPPGWTLVAARGAAASGSWLARWQASDLVLILVSALLLGRYLGVGAGLLAVLTLTLTWHLPDSPRLLWSLAAGGGLLATVLLRRGARPTGPARLARRLLALGLAGSVLYSAFTPARVALDPALDPGWQFAAPAAPAQAARHWQGPPQVLHAGAAEVAVYLLAPPATRLLAALTTLLALALAVLLLRRARHGGGPARADAAPATVLVGGLLLLGTGPVLAQPLAAFPTPELLAELQATLRAPPACAPTCASLDSVIVQVTPAPDGGSRLALTVAVQAAAATAVPLPGRQAGWWPDTVTVDGAPAAWRDGPDRAWVRVPAGPATLELAGPLAAVDLTLTFPLPPKHFLAGPTGAWRLTGRPAPGAASDTLTLVRHPAGVADAAPPAAVPPPWVQVVRQLDLGAAWQVTTTVTRAAAADAAAQVALPLLPGEQVGADGPPRDAHGQATVVFAPGATRVQWTSALTPQAMLELTAPALPAISEEWQLALDPAWAVTPSGLAESTPAGSERRRWRPWPGESLRLAVTPPPAVPPAPLTLTAAQLTTTLAADASDHVLTLTLHAAQAATHTLTLPATATAVRGDQRADDPAAPAGTVTFAVPPGEHTRQVAWRAPRPPGLRYEAPVLDLGAPAANLHSTLALPAATAVLWATPGRAGVGPVVRLWALLALIVALAGVARRYLPGAPLSALGWLLVGFGCTQAPGPLGLALALLVLLAAPRGGRRLASALLLALAGGLYQGLSGPPLTYVSGPGASGGLLHWYQDSARHLGGQTVLLVTEPLYRGLMLVWALALTLMVGRHARTGWGPGRAAAPGPLATPAAAPPPLPAPSPGVS